MVDTCGAFIVFTCSCFSRNSSGSFAVLAGIHRIGNHTFDLTQYIRMPLRGHASGRRDNVYGVVDASGGLDVTARQLALPE
jgi:hypothetical protein